MDDKPGRVPDTPFGKGNAPKTAPSQTEAVTGTGPATQGADNQPDQPAQVPSQASAGSTGPIENGPSVNYDAGQETPANVHRYPNAVTPLGEQDQRT